jgi:hypothetical protein
VILKQSCVHFSSRELPFFSLRIIIIIFESHHITSQVFLLFETSSSFLHVSLDVLHWLEPWVAPKEETDRTGIILVIIIVITNLTHLSFSYVTGDL